MWDMWQEKEKNTLLILQRASPVRNRVERKLTLDNDTFENTGKSRFFERRTSRVLY